MRSRGNGEPYLGVMEREMIPWDTVRRTALISVYILIPSYLVRVI